jgi:GntR family transcriptional repressor for pyruvate dehydrogenase complex
LVRQVYRLADRSVFGRLTIPDPSSSETQSRTNAVVENLKSYIASHRLDVGDRFPSERELAAQLGVSRPILREALAQLATLGVVESRTGSGTYLKRALSSNGQHVIVQLDSERTTLLQYLELRRALEGEVASLLAVRAGEEDIRELERLVGDTEAEHAEQGSAPYADKQFHLELYKRVGNALFLQILEPLWKVLESLWDEPLGKKDVGKGTLPLHRELVNAIRDHDPERARSAVVQIIADVERDLLR